MDTKAKLEVNFTTRTCLLWSNGQVYLRFSIQIIDNRYGVLQQRIPELRHAIMGRAYLDINVESVPLFLSACMR